MRLDSLSMCVAAMLATTILQAQEVTKVQSPPVAAKATAANDAILATWLHVGSTNAVSVSQIALKQAQHPEVRAFAQKMIDDHNAWSAKLQPLTTGPTMAVGHDGEGERRNPEPGATPKPDAKKPADASSPRTDKAASDGFDHTALIRDLGKKCLQSETKMLSSLTGAAFDRAYMAMQVADHVRTSDMIEVFETYASPNLRPTLEAGRKTHAAHLEAAKALCEKVCEVANRDDGAVGNPPRGGR